MGGHSMCGRGFWKLALVLGAGTMAVMPFAGRAEAATIVAQDPATAVQHSADGHRHESFGAVRSVGTKPEALDVLRITVPGPGQVLDRHEPNVGRGRVWFAWDGMRSARYYLVSAFDATVHAYVRRDASVGTGTHFSVADSDLRYGHTYTLSVTAVMAGDSVTDTVRFSIGVLPSLTKPVDVALDGGEVVWEGCTPELLAARDRFVGRLATMGWTIRYTSAYRTLTYQEHLYLVANTPRSGLSKADAATLNAERVRHQLSRTVARPGSADTHVRGTAFDAVVVDRYGRAKNSRSWRDRRVENLARSSGLRMLSPRLNDSVHFQLG